MKYEEGRFQKMEMFFNQAVLNMVNLDYSKNERNNFFFLESPSFGFSI